jgi:exopolysaccharide biosynthesis polyprenyl glycosylphosphotransferase
MAYYSVYSPAFYTRLVIVAVPMWLALFAFLRLYDADRLFGGLHEYAAIFNGCTVGLVGLVLYSFLGRLADQDISRAWLGMVWFFSSFGILTTRFLYRRLIYWLRSKGMFVRRALIVGTNDEGCAVAAQLGDSPQAGVRVIGFVEPTSTQEIRVDGLPVLSGLYRLGSLIQSLEIDELIVVPTALRREELLEIYRDWGTNGRVRISLSSGLYELFTTSAQVRDVGFVPMVSLNRTRITGIDAVIKALLDRVGAAVGLLVLGPVFAFFALVIKLDSPGPVIHRRRVVGLHGKRFDAFKFRTMIPNADAYLAAHPELQKEWEVNGKLIADPRITRFGRWLRSHSLDELPQLLNVLLGQMSLVGPRMITPPELRHFRRWRHNLLTVKPGLTGLWQVSGRSDLSYEDRVRMDMQYIRNYTVWLDLKLLFETVKVIIQGRGAY